MEKYKWHLIWVGALAAFAVDLFVVTASAVAKKFNIVLPGLGA